MSGSTNILEQIAVRVRARIPAELREIPPPTRLPSDFAAVFRQPGLHVIAEVKKASPSEGDIAPEAEPVAVATDYLVHGAAALSVLTEPEFFKGRPEYLTRIRAAHPGARLLMKDFVVDERQLHQALAIGADAVLLIVALLGQQGTLRFLNQARSLGLSALVEVHDEEEMRIAAACGATLIGVNNRNLKTMKVSLETSERLATLAPRDAVLISESGLSAAADLRRLAQFGFRGFLIGTSFMRTGRPGEALRKILEGAE